VLWLKVSHDGYFSLEFVGVSCHRYFGSTTFFC